MSTIEELDQRFGIPGSAEVNLGRGGFPRVVIGTSVASGEVYLHGAHVTSWRPAGAEEVLFVSERSLFQEGQAIRGGIPVCFPWFRNKLDDAKAPSHGFARTRAWELEAIDLHHHVVTVTFSLASDASTLAWFPHAFHLLYRIEFGAELTQELTMSNTGSDPLRFEEALHTYYRVGDAREVQIHGLDGVTYLDNTDGNQRKEQKGEIRFAAQTDRAYVNTTHAVEIEDPVLRRRIRLKKEHSHTTVVWNPWSTGAKTLADLGEEGWRTMACVEAGNIREDAVDLGAGEKHTMKTAISLHQG
jgi:glucose-6-phosphate 1-epimerase